MIDLATLCPGDRCRSEYGAGTVLGHTSRSLSYQLDTGERINVVVGAPGYHRVHAEPIPGAVREGHWSYRPGVDVFTIVDRRTGAAHRLLHGTFPDARRWTFEQDRAGNPQVTIASGPERARTGHQRLSPSDWA